MPRSRPSKSRATNVSRAKRRQVAPRSGASRHSGERADWSLRRRKLLRSLVARTRKTSWSAKLVTALIEELYVEDEFRTLLGDPEVLPRRRYPQAIALALALRHSWRPDDLACILGRLGFRTKLTS
jgi:hypothetical protein